MWGCAGRFVPDDLQALADPKHSTQAIDSVVVATLEHAECQFLLKVSLFSLVLTEPLIQRRPTTEGLVTSRGIRASPQTIRFAAEISRGVKPLALINWLIG
jgi:hypothetical protein